MIFKAKHQHVTILATAGIVVALSFFANGWTQQYGRHHIRSAAAGFVRTELQHMSSVWKLQAQREPTEPVITNDSKLKMGKIARLAARLYHPQDSKPSGERYTTQKESCDTIKLTANGVDGDYNHYRSYALDNTTDRAVSLLTIDCQEYLQSYNFPVRDGDMGENILVDQVDHRFFEIGKQYRFSRDDDDKDQPAVVIEITEPMVPCANLCKLPYINDPNKKPKERIEFCQNFLHLLDVEPGMRGWYAKVIEEGSLGIGDTVSLDEDDNGVHSGS